MIVYNKSWNTFGEALILVGLVLLAIFVLVFQELSIGGDYVSLAIIGGLGILCVFAGVLVKRWARKKGKN